MPPGFSPRATIYAWLGAAIIILAGLGLSELCRRHLVTAGLAHGFALATFPAIALFLIYSHYKHPLTVCLAVALGLVLSLVFERLPVRRPPVRAVVCCLVATVGFWLGGAGTLLVFALMTAIYAVLVRRDWTDRRPGPAGRRRDRLGPGRVRVPDPGPPGLRLPDALGARLEPPTGPLPEGPDVPPVRLRALAVLLVLIGKRLFGGRGRTPNVPPKKTKGRCDHAPFAAASKRRSLDAPSFARLALSALPIVLMALGLYLGGDELRKPYVLSNYYSCQKRWDKMLELAARLPKGRNNRLRQSRHHPGPVSHGPAPLRHVPLPPGPGSAPADAREDRNPT